jgi:hypothetical protein
MNEFKIYLIGGNEDEKAVATTESVDGKCKLTFSYRDKELSAQEHGYFAAFRAIREQLEDAKLTSKRFNALVPS